MAVPVAPRIRAFVLSKGKVAIHFLAVPGATSHRLYKGAHRADSALLGQNEKQTVTVDATGGTFTITYAGQTTTALAFNATAQAVEDALVALSNIALGDVHVTKVGSVYTIEFMGLLARTNVAQVTCGSGSLTGNTHTATPATLQAGVGPTDSDIDPGEIVTLAVGTRAVYAMRAANADGEGAMSNVVSLANRDYVDSSVGHGS